MGMNLLGKKKTQRCANILGVPVFKARVWDHGIAHCWTGPNECAFVDYVRGMVLKAPFAADEQNYGVGWVGEEPAATLPLAR